MTLSTKNIIVPQAKVHKLPFPEARETQESGMAGAPNAHLALYALTRTLKMLGFYLTDETCFNVISNSIIYWGHGPKYANSITLEHGWLPRWAYQLSPGGSNAFSHMAQQYRPNFPVHHSDTLLDAKLAHCRYIWCSLFDKGLQKDLDTLPKEFIIVPLQSPMSEYIQEHAERLFKVEIPRNRDGYLVLAQAMVDYIERFDLGGVPVLFKQEPRDPNDLSESLVFKNPNNGLLTNDVKVTLHQLMASGRCRGLVGFNTNSVHESLAWNVPAVSIGEFLWPKNTKRPPIPDDVSILGGHSYSNPLAMPTIRHYLKYVMDHQWELSDFQNPLIVKEILESGGLCHPYLTRVKYSVEEITQTRHIEQIASGDESFVSMVQQKAKTTYYRVANGFYELRHRTMNRLEEMLLGPDNRVSR
jgi:hypothetical protein